MKRLPYIAIAGLFLLLGWVALRPAGPREPSFQGRTLSDWLNEYQVTTSYYVKPPNAEARKEAAIQALNTIGTNAVPTLLEWLQITNPPIKDRLNFLINRQPYIHFRFRPGWNANDMAREGFQYFGKAAKPAMPALVQLLKSPVAAQRYAALNAMVKIDAKAHDLLPEFLQALRHPDYNVQMLAAVYIRDAYPEAAEQAGVYKLFPDLKPAATNTVPTNPPAAQ